MLTIISKQFAIRHQTYLDNKQATYETNRYIENGDCLKRSNNKRIKSVDRFDYSWGHKKQTTDYEDGGGRSEREN